MGVYYHLTTQIKEGDSWKTVEVNGHKTIYNCGRWLTSLFYSYPIENYVATEEFPENEKEEDTYGHVAVLLSNINSYIDTISEESKNLKEEYLKKSQFNRIEAKLDCLLNKTEYEGSDEEDDFDENDFDDERIQSLSSLVFFSRVLAELHANEYVRDNEIRMLISFDW